MFSGIREKEEPKVIYGGKQGVPPWAQAHSNRLPVSQYYMKNDYVFNLLRLLKGKFVILFINNTLPGTLQPGIFFMGLGERVGSRGRG
jgi:hypothetical protein